jgi:hypothetical protein
MPAVVHELVEAMFPSARVGAEDRAVCAMSASRL